MCLINNLALGLTHITDNYVKELNPTQKAPDEKGGSVFKAQV